MAAAAQLCSASVTLLHRPAGKDSIGLLMGAGDRGTRGQSLTHGPWFKPLLASSLVGTPSAKPSDMIEAIICGVMEGHPAPARRACIITYLG